jgi:hypothetical protein
LARAWLKDVFLLQRGHRLAKRILNPFALRANSGFTAQNAVGTVLHSFNYSMGNLKKKRRLKMSKHKRRKRLKSNRHKKRTWQK